MAIMNSERRTLQVGQGVLAKLITCQIGTPSLRDGKTGPCHYWQMAAGSFGEEAAHQKSGQSVLREGNPVQWRPRCRQALAKASHCIAALHREARTRVLCPVSAHVGTRADNWPDGGRPEGMRRRSVHSKRALHEQP